MKRFKNILLLIVAIAAFTSCEKVEKVTLSSEPVAPMLVMPQGNLEYVFTEENATNPFETFIYEGANYGLPIVVDYTVELDVVDGDFSNPTAMQEPVSKLYQTITINDFNLKMAAMGYTPGEQGTVKVRVNAKAQNDAVAVLNSNVIELKITPYDATPPSLWVVGDGTDGGWDPAASIEIKPLDLTHYEGTVNLGADPLQWRFLWQNTGWNPGIFFGDFDIVEGAIAAPENEFGEVNFMVTEAGTYKIEINLDNKSLKLTKQ